MKPGIVQAISMIATSFALSWHAQAQNTNVPPDVKAFAAQYVAAYNSKNEPQLISQYAPQSRTCVTPANKNVYDAISMRSRDTVPPGYMLSLMRVNESNMEALSTYMYFLVKPEGELHIDYQYPGTDDGGQLVLWLVHQNGRWMADFPCMTQQGIKNYLDNASAREHYKTLAADIKEPLRSELLTMLRQHKTVEAQTRYQQVTGGDMKTAMLVINALKEQVH